jgi:hypothetical protein
MTQRTKYAYLFLHELKFGLSPFWERKVLLRSEARRLRGTFGAERLIGPFEVTDTSISSGYHANGC